MSKFISALFFLFITLNSAFAAEPLPVEVYGALPKTSMVVISPSGSRIAYRVTDGDKDMMIVYEISQQKMIGAVDLSEIRPSNSYFIDEQTLILVAVKNKRLWGFRGRHEISAAFSYNLNDKKVKQLLVPGDGIYEGQTRLGNIVGISSNGQHAYMPAWDTGDSYSLMRTKLVGRMKPRKVKRGISDAIDYFIYNDQIVARERYNNKKNLHIIETLKDGRWHKLFEEETEYRSKSFVGLTADIKNLVLLAESKNGRWGYYTMSLADGSINGPIFNPEDKDVETVLTDLNRIVYGVSYSGFRPTYDFFDETLNKRISELAKELPDHSITIVDYSPDWQHIVLKLDGLDSPGDYYLFSNGKLKFIASSRPDIPAEKIHQIFETSIKARDGLRIPTLITLPIVEKLEELPAIMLPHGGPESYDRIRFDWMAQYFASRGYLVIQPQFRGSTGFGSQFTLQGRGEWGRKMQDDLTDTLKTLVASGYVDKKRVCIVGASYGGYAALAGAAFTPEIYKCAISINGLSDIKRMLRDESREYGKKHWVVAYWNEVIAEGEVDKDHIAQISPINFVEDIKIPVLLLHGTLDEVVPDHQSENMFEELEDAGKTVEYIELPKGDHYLSGSENRMRALKEIDKFLQKYL